MKICIPRRTRSTKCSGYCSRQITAVRKPFVTEDQTLLVRQNTLIVLDLGLHVLDSVVRLDKEENISPCQTGEVWRNKLTTQHATRHNTTNNRRTTQAVGSHNSAKQRHATTQRNTEEQHRVTTHGTTRRERRAGCPGCGVTGVRRNTQKKFYRYITFTKQPPSSSIRHYIHLSTGCNKRNISSNSDNNAKYAHADDTIGATVWCACVTMCDTVLSSQPCSMYT